MGRGLFLLLISNFIGVALSSGVLMMADDVAVDVTNFDAVETVEIEGPAEPADIEQIAQSFTPAEPVAVANDTGSANNVGVAANYVASVNYTNSISIAGQTIEVIDVVSEKLDAGYHVNRLGGKFLYGHNSSAVFGGLVIWR